MLMLLVPVLAVLAEATPIRIAFYNGGGSFVGSQEHERDFYASINTAAASLSKTQGTHFILTNITEKNCTAALLTTEFFDLVIFPGGSGTGQADALGPSGMAAVRSFVRKGGGYVGTCGGAFLAMAHLDLYGGPVPTVEPWARGHGPVSVQFTPNGVSSLQLPGIYGDGKNVTIEYWQGPIVATADLPPFVNVLSFFRTEIHNEHTNQTTGTMVNTPAMTSALYGKGRVVLNSPHPEIPPEPSGGQPGIPPGRTRPEIYEGELAWVLRLHYEGGAKIAPAPESSVVVTGASPAAESSVVVTSASPAADLQAQFEVLPSSARSGLPSGWLGADSDVSIVIAGGVTGRRALWIFADTYISDYDDATEQREWSGMQMPHSTVALVECQQKQRRRRTNTATRECSGPPKFHWRTGPDGHAQTFWVLPPSQLEGAPLKPLLWPVAGLASRDGTQVILLAQRILGGLNLVGSDAIVLNNVTAADPTSWAYTTTPIPSSSSGTLTWFSTIEWAKPEDLEDETVYLFGHDSSLKAIGRKSLLARANFSQLLKGDWSDLAYWTTAGWLGGPSNSNSSTVGTAPLPVKMAQNLDLRCVLQSDPSTLGTGGPTHVSNPGKMRLRHIAFAGHYTATAMQPLDVPSWETTLRWSSELQRWYTFNVDGGFGGGNISLWTATEVTGEWESTYAYTIPAPFTPEGGDWLCTHLLGRYHYLLGRYHDLFRPSSPVPLCVSEHAWGQRHCITMQVTVALTPLGPRLDPAWTAFGCEFSFESGMCHKKKRCTAQRPNGSRVIYRG